MKCAPFKKTLATALLLFAGPLHAASSVQAFTPATNDRFANDPSFVGASYDFSGVGRDSGGRWVTMLTDRVFITSNHNLPSGTVTFFPGNDPLSTPVTATVSEGERIGVTDLWIGRLGTALPGSIASYGFSTEPLDEVNFTSSALLDEFVFMGGISQTATGYGASPLTNEVVGTNRLEGFLEDLLVESALDATGDVLITVQNEPGDAGFSHTTYETQFSGGDSGSPLLILSGGDLVVAGIALAVGTLNIDPETERPGAVSTYTGSYAPQIQAYINATPVPEISTAWLACLGLSLVKRRR